MHAMPQMHMGFEDTAGWLFPISDGIGGIQEAGVQLKTLASRKVLVSSLRPEWASLPQGYQSDPTPGNEESYWEGGASGAPPAAAEA